jgi:hypothetical protein
VTTRHGLHIYQTDGHLARCVAMFAKSSLDCGETVILVPSRPHRELILGQLRRLGVDVPKAVGRRRLVLRDADLIAEQSVAAGSVEAAWREFRSLLESAGPRVAVWGEATDRLLQMGQTELYLRLERLWCEATVTSLSLRVLCSYRADPLDERIYDGDVQDGCANHTHLHSMEDAGRLEGRVAEALEGALGARLSGIALTLADSARSPLADLPAPFSRLIWLHANMPVTWQRIVAQLRERIQLAS